MKQYKTLLKEIIENVEYSYRVSESRWAGGNHTTNWSFGDSPKCSCVSHKVWSKNGKWSGYDSEAFLTITKRAARLFDGQLNVGGLITLDAELVGNREYKIVFAKQSRGFNIIPVDGWLIKGYHIEGGTLEAA